MTVHMAAIDDVFGGDLFSIVFPQGVSWVGSKIEWCPCLKIPTYFFKQETEHVMALRVQLSDLMPF